VASSGAPYNVALGQDLIGSSIFNQRPAFAGALSNPANVVVTPIGAFDTVPQPGETLVPVNFLTGPSQFSLNLRLAKTFSFGRLPEGSAGQVGARQNGGGGGGRRGPGGGAPPVAGGGFGGGGGAPTAGRYSIVLSVNVRNIFNNVNLSTPIGNLGSPLFGESTGLSNGGFGFGGGAQTSGAGATAGLPSAAGGAPAANRQIFLQATFGF
jgi:hypothetical protein